MDPVWVLVTVSAWIVVSVVVALAIGRLVRRAEQDDRLYGSWNAPHAGTRTVDEPDRAVDDPQP